MLKYHPIEVAFSKIKQCTGNSDVREMVTKYMTKEQTYSHLLQQVGKGEKKFEQLKQENEDKRKQLQDLKMVHDGHKNLNGPAPRDDREKAKKEALMKTFENNAEPNDKSSDIEYIRCCREIEQLQAELDQTNER